MTTAAQTGVIVPSFNLRDRMGKCLEVAEFSVADMATVLGVSRQTVNNWLSGRYKPQRATLVAWALATGVDLTWLETGQAPAEPGPDEGIGTPPGTRTLNPLINTRRLRAVAA